MKKSVLISMLILIGLHLFSQNENLDAVEHSPANSQCFNCHGSQTYTYYNGILERHVTKRMNPYFIIDSVLYYDQNHKSFECTDCHSYDFKSFPHDNDLRLESMPYCMDCHEGDDETAAFNFETITEEYQKSVHSTRHRDDFTCWMCHNPHSYKINVRNNDNLSETIVYDNNICLSCHANINKYQLISPMENPNIIEKHDWVPNQIAHFTYVRCIECHTHTTMDILVAHNIQTKDEAVRKCIECHSQNSILMASLYKFQAKEKRNKYGFFNAAILSVDSYVIGANRNYYLNLASGIIFGLVLLLISIHIVLRILTK